MPQKFTCIFYTNFFLFISNENIFFKTQGTRLGLIVTPKKKSKIGSGKVLETLCYSHYTNNYQKHVACSYRYELLTVVAIKLSLYRYVGNKFSKFFRRYLDKDAFTISLVV